MLKNKIPPPLYMLIFGVLMYLLAEYFPVVTLLTPPVNNIAYAFAGLALLMDLSALLLFFRLKTTPNPIKPENANMIVTRGMYRISRNPMYVGLFFWLVVWAIKLSVLSPFLLLPLFIWVITVQQIIPEEKALEKKFGDSYLNYKNRVRRWI